MLFSNRYADRGDLFEGLSIWDEKSPEGVYNYRKLQGTYPVIALSFASVKTGRMESLKKAVKQIITNLYAEYREMMQSAVFADADSILHQSMMTCLTRYFLFQ